MKLNSYLTFGGNCEEAMNFYKAALGGEFVSVNHFKDGPADMGVPDHLKDKVMHMTLQFGDNTLMASDDMMGGAPAAGNIALSLNFDNTDTVDGLFEKLSAGGTVIMPLENTFWGSRFGMFTDQFGVKWMLNAQLAQTDAAAGT